MCQLVDLRTQHRAGGLGPNFQHRRPSQRHGAAARARLDSSADGAPFWSRSSVPAQGELSYMSLSSDLNSLSVS